MKTVTIRERRNELVTLTEHDRVARWLSRHQVNSGTGKTSCRNKDRITRL